MQLTKLRMTPDRVQQFLCRVEVERIKASGQHYKNGRRVAAKHERNYRRTT